MVWDEGQVKALEQLRDAYEKNVRSFTLARTRAGDELILQGKSGRVDIELEEGDFDLFVDEGLLEHTMPTFGGGGGRISSRILTWKEGQPPKSPAFAIHQHYGDVVHGNKVDSSTNTQVSAGHDAHVHVRSSAELLEVSKLREELIEAIAREVVDRDERIVITEHVDKAIVDAKEGKLARAKAYVTSAAAILGESAAAGLKLEQLWSAIQRHFTKQPGA